MKINRLNSIEQYVIAKETVSIDELCEVFGVSKNTIRRDLNDLETRGRIVKVYGGVTAVPTGGTILPAPVRSSINLEDKILIGRLAAEEVRDGDTIFVDSGTTTLCMLRHLTGRKKLTIVTHSLAAMSEASKYSNLSLICPGGIYSPPTDSFVGLSTFEALAGMNINKAFMSATGISLERGMTNTTFLEAEIKRGVTGRASSVYLLADDTKLDTDAIISFCQLRDLTAFITNQKPPERYKSFFRAQGIRVLYG